MSQSGFNTHDRRELLVSKLADGEASEADWAAFDALAASRPDAWRELALAQRHHAAMSLAVGVALHGAERVDLPEAEGAAAPPVHLPTWSRLGAWAGWAAAACLALAWTGTLRGPGAGGSPAPQAAGVVPVGNFEDAQRAYLDFGQRSGRVVGELPQRLLVEARPVAPLPRTPAPGAPTSFEVVYVRQFVERVIVTDLVGFTQDETGRAVPVRVHEPVRVGGPD